ncbi:MAG: hypothetical protein M0R74_09400 [Dehalococcoidia bacterium]|nr:hypothetical protein [Dehalococcoidia bacterium]
MHSWTASWLTEGCGPMGHTLIAIATEGEAPVLRCTRCARREVVGGETCLVCNNTGEGRYTMYRTNSSEPVGTGGLCTTCAAELLQGLPVEGWLARPASEAACADCSTESFRAG